MSDDAKDVSSPSSKDDADDLSSPSSEASEGSVPQTPRREGEIFQSSSNLKSFTSEELKAATRNFRADSVLGESGFGSVFKGWIEEHSPSAAKPGTGIVVAVKRLNQDVSKGHKDCLVSLTPIYFFESCAHTN